MRSLKLVSIVLCLLLCSGCNKKRGLMGQWELDRAYTESQLSGEEPAMVGVLLSMFEGKTLTFLDDELRIVDAAGSGESRKYELIEKPNSKSWQIQMEDGKIETWFRDGERLRVSSSGGAIFDVYFQRKTR